MASDNYGKVNMPFSYQVTLCLAEQQRVDESS